MHLTRIAATTLATALAGAYGLPPEGGSYAAEGGSYAAEGGSYAAEGGSYAAEGGSYAAERGSYAAERGSYAAEGGSYAAEGGSYAAEGGSYARAQKPPMILTILSAETGGPGDVVRLDVICNCDAADMSATVFGRTIPLARIGDRWQGLIGIDLDVGPGTYPIEIAITPTDSGAIAPAQKLKVIDRKYPVRRLRVAPVFVDPPASEVARIQQDAAALQAIFEAAGGPRQWQGAFHAPVSDPPNSSFGARSIYNGQPRSPHSGTDFSAKAGTLVTAPASGIVALARPLYFTGNTVVLDHGLGLYSTLAHLQEIGVQEGDHITRGEVVGLVGGTGRVTAPHLHWSVRLNNARVDPLALLAVTKDLSE